MDTAVMDAMGKPALSTLVQVAFIPLNIDILPMVVMSSPPGIEYPHSRGASFRLDYPGTYRIEIMLMDASGMVGTISTDVLVQTVNWQIKAAILVLGILSVFAGLWILFQSRAFWAMHRLRRRVTPRHLRIQAGAIRHSLIRSQGLNIEAPIYVREVYVRGGQSFMSDVKVTTFQRHLLGWYQLLNGRYHAPALWIFMLIIVAHWLEHVLQIYQIYGLGWAPATAGGLLGVIYPQLVESEILHFVYDFIQWSGIIVLRPGFHGRARTLWTVAMVIQTWHYIEHVLLMGQYLTGHYLFGAAHQISIGQLWFPRAELHFFYNLFVFVPMVIAVHYYLKSQMESLAATSVMPTELVEEPALGIE
jgi:hypothetical protein